jgi:anti-sigma factor (TIGR02949 family)
MRCETTLRLLNAYVDAELDRAEAAALEAHLTECAACREQQRRVSALKDAVKSKAEYYRAPASLRAAVVSQIGQRAPQRVERRGRPQWLGYALAAGLAAAFASGITLQLAVPSAYELAAADVVSSHARSLMSRQIVDVVSSDQHTVKPWFNGRLDFTPPVKDTGAEGFALVGGRVDYVNERAVAGLVYKRRQHYIDVYVWPSERGSVPALRTTARRGFTVLSWSDRDFTYFTVSDLDPVELREFARHLGAPAPNS